MTDTNGRPPLNGRVVVLGIAGLGGVSGLLSALAFFANMWIGPLEKIMMRQALDIARLESEISRIGNLAAERGVAIPRLQADVARLEAKLERLEQRPADHPRP